MPAGRPSKYSDEFVERAQSIAALGASDQDAALHFGVNVATIHRWKLTHPEFCDALKVGKAAADERVVQSLYRKATGYSFDAVKIMIVDGAAESIPYVEHVPPSDTAAIFWLKNRRPTEWRDIARTEHTGLDGGAIEHRVDMSGLSDEECRMIAKIRLLPPPSKD